MRKQRVFYRSSPQQTGWNTGRVFARLVRLSVRWVYNVRERPKIRLKIKPRHTIRLIQYCCVRLGCHIRVILNAARAVINTPSQE